MNVANDTNSLASSATHSTFEDSQNRIWIGTRDGISLLLPNGKFKNYTTKNGLPNNAINGILEDKKGNLWITTNQGLSKFNPQNQTFTNYFESDGLTSSQFKINSVFKDKKGYMYLGTIKGLNVFHPDSIQSNPHLPNVYLTDFKIFNKSVKIGEFDSLLTKVIGQTQTITLTYQHSVFSFDFVALNFTHSEKNQYAYIMEGFEKEWNYVGHQRTATYTNLDAGTYTFRVKASNNDGVWNEKGISIKIIILPPWWETWWFRTLLIGSIILGAFLFYRWRVRAIEAQKNRLEKLVEERTFELKEKNNEVSQQAEELMQQAEELLTQRDFIQAQNQQLAIQNQLVEEKNQQIRQSINAALTIQKAILPHQKKLEHLLGEHFVLYNPKDVVSGDFYWLHQIENKTIVVVADCTGHGVPGAFMTLIGNSLLDKIVRVLKITDPAEILTQLHQEVFRSLKQKYTGNNYGMDAIALCIDKMDENQPKITFSGAKNSIYIVDGIDNQNVKILKGSRRAIGGQQNASIPFDNQVVSLHQGSLVYLGSDGFIDQNNPRRKRFGSDKFVQLIKSYADKGLDEQAQLFKQALEQHMQDTHQRDDILLMGFKV
jgi:serine phosphatase RsbU (regulator of sigma subunit)